MLPGDVDGKRTYRSYVVGTQCLVLSQDSPFHSILSDLQGGSSHDSHYKYRDDDTNKLAEIQPLKWPEHLCSPLAADGKMRLLLYLKGNNPSVWRVLVEVSDLNV